MDIRKLIKINMLNLGILLLIVVFRFATGLLFNEHDSTASLLNLSNVITVLFGLAWGAYTVYSNMAVLKEDDYEKKKDHERVKQRVRRGGNARFFKNERQLLLTLIESLEVREKYFHAMDSTSKLRELYDLTLNQMLRNATNAAEYMETFDYISGRDNGYVRGVCHDSEELLQKFNKLVELSVTYDDTYRSYDTRELDDMIYALETMRDTGKGALGS